MPRRLRLWEKKRGDRLTGSRLIGSAGEAMFFAALALFGSITLIELFQAGLLQAESAESVQAWGWFVITVLAALIGIGIIGGVYTVLRAGTSVERRRALAKRASDIDLLADHLPSSKDFPNIPRDVNQTNSPGIRLAYRLPIVHSPSWKVFRIGTFMVLWNTMVACLAWLVISDFRSGEADWYLLALTVPFAIVGIASAFYFFRTLFWNTAIGPTSLEISAQPVYPGGTYKVFLSQSGRLSVRSLEVTLVCEEEATFRQGTDTRTERRRVHEQSVLLRENFEILPSAPFEDQGELNFPKNVMHSFQADHNAVYWKLVVHGVVEKWSNFERKFPLVVYPTPLMSTNGKHRE